MDGNWLQKIMASLRDHRRVPADIDDPSPLPAPELSTTVSLWQVERDIAQIDATIETIITSDRTLSEKADILISIPGIAKVTAFAMLIDPLVFCGCRP